MYVGSIYSVTKKMKSYVQEIELEAMLSGTELDSDKYYLFSLELRKRHESRREILD